MIIDSSALIAVLEKEDEAELFLHLMYEADTLNISAVTYAEVSLVLYSRFGSLVGTLGVPFGDARRRIINPQRSRAS
ncbi:MAG: PIN domain-containing protein [Methylobacter sp.]|nr:MAG: PIN domain-containing protein [Methylobacter sp.]